MLYLLLFVCSTFFSMIFFFFLKKRNLRKTRDLLMREITSLQSALQKEMATHNVTHTGQDITALLATLPNKENLGKLYYIYNKIQQKQFLLTQHKVSFKK